MQILMRAAALALAAAPFVWPQIPTLIATLSKPRTTMGALHVTRVNAGGGQFTDSGGRNWAADTNTTVNTFGIGSTAIADTVDDDLFITEAYGAPMTYTFSVPNGLYTVRLRFAEIYFGVPGDRVFHVDINGVRVETNFDIMVFGPFRAVDRTYNNINVTSGVINLVFTGVIGNAKVSAIEILQTSQPGAQSTTRLLSQFPTVATNGCVGGDVTSRVAAALTALTNGETLVFDCMAEISGSVVVTGKSNITLDASTGGGVRFTGNPAQNAEIFGLTSCTNCTVKHLTIDGNGRQAIPFTVRTSTALTFQYNTVKNAGPLASAFVLARGGSNNKFLDNTLSGFSPTFVTGSVTSVSALGPRAFWIGSGTDEENSAEIARNTATSSANAFIVLAGSAGSIHHNTATNLVAESVIVANSENYPGAGTTLIDANTFRGSLNGWSMAGEPLNGGGITLSMGGTSTGIEQFLIRNNTIDGGKYGIAFTGKVGPADVHHNYLINQWQKAALFTGTTSIGDVRIHHNWIAHPRVLFVQGNDLGSAIHVLASTAINLHNITVDNNYVADANIAVHLVTQHPSAVITGLNINTNSFVNNRAQALYLDQTAGSIASPTLTPANCYSGNNGTNNAVFDSRGLLLQPTQVSSCPNPTGLTAP